VGRWLGGERRCHARRIERHKVVGPFPEQHVGREVVVDAPSDTATTVGVEVPTRRRGNFAEGDRLLLQALHPSLQVDHRGDVVALLVVAAMVGGHEVVQPVVGQADPRDEFVNIDDMIDRLSVATIQQTHQNLTYHRP